jgi:hypothetical protein
MDVITQIFLWFVVQAINHMPGKFVDWVLGLIGRRRSEFQTKKESISLYPSDCGDRRLDLGYRKPHVSEYFGGYFAGLLEEEGGYFRIDEQIDCPSSTETANLAPVTRILYEFRKPTGPRLIVIAAAGGMGKTTLASKIVKCLYEQKDADFILGDSAKTEHADPTTGAVYKIDPSFSDTRSFYQRLYTQVGLPTPPANTSTAHMIDMLGKQLRDFSAVIVVDNLETIKDIQALLTTLQPLLARDVRALVTTRTIGGLNPISPLALAVNLRPITTVENARAFLYWHIQHYQSRRPRLAEIGKGLTDKHAVEVLIRKTGGIPLVMQLVLNDVETKTWMYVENLPVLQLSSELLDYLYKERWNELEQLRPVGKVAQQLIQFIGAKQMAGKRVSFNDLTKWAKQVNVQDSLNAGMNALEDRFLLLNRDIEKGNFSVFPSLAEFVKEREMAR